MQDGAIEVVKRIRMGVRGRNYYFSGYCTAAIEAPRELRIAMGAGVLVSLPPPSGIAYTQSTWDSLKPFITAHCLGGVADCLDE